MGVVDGSGWSVGVVSENSEWGRWVGLVVGGDR